MTRTRTRTRMRTTTTSALVGRWSTQKVDAAHVPSAPRRSKTRRCALGDSNRTRTQTAARCACHLRLFFSNGDRVISYSFLFRTYESSTAYLRLRCWCSVQPKWHHEGCADFGTDILARRALPCYCKPPFHTQPLDSDGTRDSSLTLSHPCQRQCPC